jgi:hypothetical protein
MDTNVFEQRFYNAPPEKKSLDCCAEHGYQHKAYGWSKQIDPRWSDEQKQAYLNAYNSKIE